MGKTRPATWQDQLEAAARRFLRNEFLSERAARLGVLARWIQEFAEVKAVSCSRRAVEAAVWFQDAWCVEDVRARNVDAALVLAQGPTNLQRERTADIAWQHLEGLIDDATRETAVQAIRSAALRETAMPEAQVLAEATNLDSIGPLWLWGQMAKCSKENRPLVSVVTIWERQIEYGYWPKLINETLRFPRSRQLARERCAVLEGFLLALRRQLDGSDRHLAPEEHP
ncbi:MAG TPA: hypothetical protein VMV94_20510 [Phycisphaerae bacterium]|nr:hypothetical protein [Phycisphaerae bacterium]